MKLSRLSALALLLCLLPFARAQKPNTIEKKEIADWYNKNYDCPEKPPMYFYTFERFAFKGDGTQQAIVVAMSCAGGTGGPDIHSVISRDSDGELEELKIVDPDPKTYDNLFGNRNYELTVENGFLVATFTDDGDRDTPLIIKYKWNGKEFAVASLQKTGIFPTSYDCAKATREVARAICHVDSLAHFDLELSALYKSLLANLTRTEQALLRDEQRKWLMDATRNALPTKAGFSVSPISTKDASMNCKNAPQQIPKKILCTRTRLFVSAL
jgi:uncharacterized protein YecT (DUF1311 family)